MQGPSGDAPSVRFGENSEVQLKVRLAIQGIGTAWQPSVVGKLINQSREYTLPALGSEIEGISLRIKEH